MTVFVIVVTYNGEQWIDKCFGSLINSTIPLEIYAIDNASSDATVSVIKERFPQVHLIETGSNLGFGKANNIGLKIALEENADYVFLLNQDAWVEKDTVERLVTISNADSKFGITSPFHFNWDGSKVDHYFLMMVNPNDCPDFVSDHFLKNTRDIYALNFIHAACWLISKNCLEDVGGFDPLFYHYGEDNDYIKRIKYFNYKVGIIPSVNVYHYGFFDTSKAQESNLGMKTIEALLELKNLQGRLIANYFFFFKARIDRCTSLLFAKKIKNAGKEFQFAFRMLKYYSSLKRSRGMSKQKKAFL